MSFPVALSLIALSFLCGAIPTGYLLVKIFRHRDIRDVGSGNIGSTNVKRAAGITFSLITQAIDILKGAFPVGLALFFIRTCGFRDEKMLVLPAVALASILGHDFSPFLRFRGGKGVNTTLGAFLLLTPIPVITGIGVFCALRILTPIVSMRSLVLGFTIPIMAGITGSSPAILVILWIAALLIVVRHAENIQRLLRRRELK